MSQIDIHNFINIRRGLMSNWAWGTRSRAKPNLGINFSEIDVNLCKYKYIFLYIILF